ncbi:MAG: dihydroneopterin aldolase [Deltaproteobacteria bacterium]|nr:dihydroneopterin aldolase [Deltaproteobacteria bacterium]
MENGDWIELTDLAVDCMVGVLEREQRATQRVMIDVRLFAALETAGETGELAASSDYGAVASQIRLIAEHGRFRLIESLGVAIARLVLAPPTSGESRAQVSAVELRIRKPEVLAPLTIPGIHLFRSAGRPLSTFEVATGAWGEILVDLPQGGAWRIRLDPAVEWKPASDLAIEVIAGALEGGSSRVYRAGDRLARGADALMAHGPSTLLAVGRW